jgi:hypothetical protein
VIHTIERPERLGGQGSFGAQATVIRGAESREFLDQVPRAISAVGHTGVGLLSSPYWQIPAHWGVEAFKASVGTLVHRDGWVQDRLIGLKNWWNRQLG